MVAHYNDRHTSRILAFQFDPDTHVHVLDNTFASLFAQWQHNGEYEVPQPFKDLLTICLENNLQHSFQWRHEGKLYRITLMPTTDRGHLEVYVSDMSH